MAKKVVRTGVSLDNSIAKKLEEIIKKSPELKLDRSEVINSILDSYFKDSNNLTETKETIMKKRKKEL